VLFVTAIGATWFCSDAASALDVGPVSVPLPPPPSVTVTVPTTIAVGGAVVPVTQVAPGLGGSVTLSPQTGASATVSLPTSIGPVPVLPGTTTPAPGSPAGTGGGVAVSRPPQSSPGVVSRPAQLSVRGADVPRVRTSTTRALALGAQSRNRAEHVPATIVESRPGAVNASLQHSDSGGLWSLLHDLASAHGLWIALLLIVAIARFAAGGLMHDAFRRRIRFIR
jgi:hypothetical protein